MLGLTLVLLFPVGSWALSILLSCLLPLNFTYSPQRNT